MPRIIHIKDGLKTNTSIAGEGWVEPADGSQMIESDERLNGMEWVSKPTPSTPPAAAYQVRAYLIRNGIDLASIPTLITSITAAGPERDEALMRWEFVESFPKKHPLVAAVAASLNLDLDQVWGEILAIE
jgi:hypothetical protein